MIRALIAALALLGVQTSAQAAERAQMFQAAPTSGCGTALQGTGKPAALTAPLNEVQRTGLLGGVFLAMSGSGAGWTEGDVEAALACPVARFVAGERVWTIHSGAGTAPLRIVTAQGAETSYVFLRGPNLADAATWHASRGASPVTTTGPAYYLAGLSDGVAYIARIYDAPPTMEALADDITDAEIGDAIPLAAYSLAGGVVSLILEADSGPRAEIFRPADLNGEQMATMFLPDGRLVSQGDEGDFVFKGSGFRCPPAFGAFERQSLSVLNADEERLNLGCNLATETAGLSVFVMRAPDTSGDKRYWNDEISRSQQATGVTRKISLPPMGPKRAIQAGSNWLDKDGRMQVVLFARRGDYVVEVRQTYELADSEPASKALMALADELDRMGAGDVEASRSPREQR
ncbi:hypothetical protein [Phenylobacterium sp. J367]|uniref:hypothetical protein n=1 Tax=Phenylobacterium sp. J367 TaxID=2898435 RepID=UPI002151507B|nr:hypothetical protein [Phenylobacterium sp. J367]MCR5880473.1 hypothetical protein [Phenylobacterium sp. J367]